MCSLKGIMVYTVKKTHLGNLHGYVLGMYCVKQVSNRALVKMPVCLYSFRGEYFLYMTYTCSLRESYDDWTLPRKAIFGHYISVPKKGLRTETFYAALCILR